MTSARLVITWGTAVVGRERQAVRLFDESVEYWTQLCQARVLVSYEALLLEPHGGDLAGCFILRGEVTQLAQLRESTEFQRLCTWAGLVVTHYRVVSACSGEAVNQRFAQYSQVAAEVA